MKRELRNKITEWGLVVGLVLLVFLLFLGGAEPSSFDEDSLDEYYYNLDTYINPISRVVGYTILGIAALLTILNLDKIFKK
jgi:RsiW-degrading membrane proteinase PrsW (M82 family)